MKRAVIGGFFFLGGAILLLAEMLSGGGLTGIVGMVLGVAGLAILIYEFLKGES